MKRLLLAFNVLIFFTLNLTAQPCEGGENGTHLHANDVRAYINNSGSLFFDGEGPGFQVPYDGEDSPHSIFAQGLWLGGFDPGGNLRVSAQTYGLATQRYDYWPGPLSGAVDCEDWDKVWTVTREEVEAHREDYADNNTIDELIPSIMSWPGVGNPFFEEYNGFPLPDSEQGFAPFQDVNTDGIYNPLDGDYPVVPQSELIPEQITWTVFNDLPTGESMGTSLRFEIQLTSWALSCSDNEQLNRTVFNSYKLINRGPETIDSLYFGLWTDFDLGCFEDDYIGSAPELNTTYVYNNDEEDPDCGNDVIGYGSRPPAQAVTILNRDLAYLTYYNNGAVAQYPPGMTDPNFAIEYYYFLTGRWRDGAPLTFGGDGYEYDQPGNNPPTNFAFPDNPNDDEGWSMNTQSNTIADRRTIGSVYLDKMEPGAAEVVDVGYSFFQVADNDHLENVSAMYDGVEDLQNWYGQAFTDVCSEFALCEEDCVWTGDTNADGTANNCDLLPVGLEIGEDGPPRVGPYIWSPRDANAWSDTQFDGTNVKHVDANGNGLISPGDVAFIEAHYGKTRPDYEAPADVYIEGPELTFTALLPTDVFDDLEEGEEFYATVNIANVPELYGLAYSLEFDSRYFEALTPIGDSPSLSLLDLNYENVEGGQSDFARVSIDPQMLIEEGLLHYVYVRVKEEFDEPLPSETTLIRFKNIKAVRSDGTPIDIGGTTVVATFDDIMVSTADPIFDQSISVFPNPTSDLLNVVSKEVPIEQLSLLNLSGQELLSKTGLSGRQAALSVAHLPEGLYLLKISSGEKVVVRKVMLE